MLLLVHYRMRPGLHLDAFSKAYMDSTFRFTHRQPCIGTHRFGFHLSSHRSPSQPSQFLHHTAQPFLAGVLVHTRRRKCPVCVHGPALNIKTRPRHSAVRPSASLNRLRMKLSAKPGGPHRHAPPKRPLTGLSADFVSFDFTLVPRI
jgi:hypothetical protein